VYVFCKSKKQTVQALLQAAGFEPHQPLDWQDGQVVRARSGYVLAPDEHPGSLRLSHHDLSAAEAVERDFHTRMREALHDVDGLTAEQVDNTRVRNIGVRVSTHREVTAADRALLEAARDGRLTQHAGRWSGSQHGLALDTRTVPDLLLTGWIERRPDGNAHPTDYGTAALNTVLPAPSVSLVD
jgi:hypothetical protein